jgi:vacuolar-type H+-ATPase subunit H
MSTFGPRGLEQIEQEERDAQLRLAEAREQAKLNDGEASEEHNTLLQKLEDEWHRAVERLEQARHGKKD